MYRRIIPISSLLLIVGISATATAQSALTDSGSMRVVGGKEVETCSWPTTVFLGGCTGTLVHPKLVTYAAHCGSRVRKVSFGEKRPFHREVEVDYCKVYPGATSNPSGPAPHNDYAFCVLKEEVNDVPITPILMGCETEILEEGGMVTIAGYGNIEGNKTGKGFGVKREVEVPINFVSHEHGMIGVGGDGKGACHGDSGGPLFVQLPESLDPHQSWRVLGVTSGGPLDCPGATIYGMLHDIEAVPWMEKESMIDITPCHGADGKWNPGPDCGNFSIRPGASGNSWDNMCTPDADQFTGMSSTCGPPYDMEAPTVSIVSPGDKSVFASTEMIKVEVNAEDNTGIQKVDLLVDGASVGEKTAEPFLWDIGPLDEGDHTIQALATDIADNEAESDLVSITTNTVDDSDTDETTGDDDNDDASDVDDTSDDDESSSDGDNTNDDDESNNPSEKPSSDQEDSSSNSPNSDSGENDSSKPTHDSKASMDSAGGCQLAPNALGFSLAGPLHSLLLGIPLVAFGLFRRQR